MYNVDFETMQQNMLNSQCCYKRNNKRQ